MKTYGNGREGATTIAIAMEVIQERSHESMYNKVGRAITLLGVIDKSQQLIILYPHIFFAFSLHQYHFRYR